ncbi:MAG TPA: S8 family serine peptidase [Gemmatimonadaceae bacterium]|nr:S8 family serine peptidase [Gemmatimonadaceae bacterium]
MLGAPPLVGSTGRGIRVAVVDSGVHENHPHIGSVIGGVRLGVHDDDADYGDRLGHGTAVCAAIHEKAPDAELLAIKIFDTSLSASSDVLARAIRYAVEQGARLVNLSLGTTNPLHLAELRAAVAAASRAGALVVAARDENRTHWLPGAFAEVFGVSLDWSSPRHQLDMVQQGETLSARASGFPRPIPGVPPHRNVSGISFAVANATGLLALLLQGEPSVRTMTDVARLLNEREAARS